MPARLLRAARRLAMTRLSSTDSLSPKVSALADSICQLNLLETAELCNVLKKRLNLADVPMAVPMAGGPAAGVPAAGAAGAAPAAAAEEPVAEKSTFDVKLESFDAAAKIKIIREVRAPAC